MSKLFKPVMGTPVDDYLVQMVVDVKEDRQKSPSTGPRMSRSAKEVEKIAEAVRLSLNTGTCMNESQAGELKRSILYDRRADTTVVKELIDRVNGFRLECEHCLRKSTCDRLPHPKPDRSKEYALEKEIKAKWDKFSDEIDEVCKAELPKGMTGAIRSRAWNCLMIYCDKLGVWSVDDLSKKSATELLQLKNFGSQSLRYIEAVLVKRGLSLKKD